MINIPWNRIIVGNVEIMYFTFVYFQIVGSPGVHEEHEPGPWLLYSTMIGFPHIGTCNIWSQITLCCRVLSYACRMFSSLYPLDASSTLSPHQPTPVLFDNQKYLQTRPYVPRGQIALCWNQPYCQSLLSRTAGSGDSPGGPFTQGSTHGCWIWHLKHAGLIG